MAPLPDLQLEHFARALARGASPFAALVKAGIKRGRAEADHLAKDAGIAARVAELRPAISQEIVTTPEKQFRAFEEVRLLAMARGRSLGRSLGNYAESAIDRGCFGAVPFREGGFREPMTNRERAIRILKHVVRELKRRGSAGTAEVEAVINKLAGKHTVLSEDLPPICEPSSPAKSQIAALTSAAPGTGSGPPVSDEVEKNISRGSCCDQGAGQVARATDDNGGRAGKS